MYEVLFDHQENIKIIVNKKKQKTLIYKNNKQFQSLKSNTLLKQYD